MLLLRGQAACKCSRTPRWVITIGEVLHFAHFPFQYRNLEVVIVADVHMQRGDGEIAVMVLGGNQPARQLALLVLVHVESTA